MVLSNFIEIGLITYFCISERVRSSIRAKLSIFLLRRSLRKKWKMCVSNTCNTTMLIWRWAPGPAPFVCSEMSANLSPIQVKIIEKDPLFYQVSIYLLVKNLFSWLSVFQELFTVKHSMFIVQMTANIPVIHIHVYINKRCVLGESSH